MRKIAAVAVNKHYNVQKFGVQKAAAEKSTSHHRNREKPYVEREREMRDDVHGRR